MFFIIGEEIQNEEQSDNLGKKNSISNFTNPIVQTLHQGLEKN